MAAMTIAASGADKASWELTKLIQQSIRKQSYLDGMIHAPTKDANFEMDIGKISSSVANNPNAATNLFQNHDVSFLVNGWVLALEDARNGDDPNNLLALASEPVKMAMAIQFANAVVLGELKQTTNNWQSLPKAQYAAFVDKGSELMHDYVKSDEFKSVMSAINTKEHEPKLTVSLDMSSDYEEPKSKSQMKL
jgi:hypothetical protein